MKKIKKNYTLGISIYPERMKGEYLIPYLDKCKASGFSRVFTNMLSISKENLDQLEIMKETYKKIVNGGFDLTIDVAPSLYKTLGIKPDSKKGIDFFKKMKATGIRFDEDYGGKIEANVLKHFDLEINASTLDTSTAERIISEGGQPSKIIACHNFYPQKYTGLSKEFFEESSKAFQKLGIRVSAFVTLDPNRKTIGAWDVNDGMPTLEFHRHEDISFQIRWLFATNLIENVIVSSQYLIDRDLKEVKRISLGSINVKAKLSELTTPREKEILNNQNIFLRGEWSDDLLARCSITRFIYKDVSIPARKIKKKYFSPGDIVILNNNYKRYKGEILFIKSKSVVNDGTKNLVGYLEEREMQLFEGNSVQNGRRLKLIL